MRHIQKEAEQFPIDAVLYLDRLDFYRVEPVDEAVRFYLITFAFLFSLSIPS